MEKLYSCRKWSSCGLLVLFVIISTEAAGRITLNTDFSKYKTFDYKGDLLIQCNYSVDAGQDTTVSWYKNDKPIVQDERVKSQSSSGGNELVITRAIETDAANYVCQVGSLNATITTVMKPYVKLSPHTSVVEGEKLTIPCLVFGSPVPIVSWTVGNKTYRESEGRVKLLKSKEKEVPNAILQIDSAEMDDRESYTCFAEIRVESVVINATETSTFVRVKDKMAALWPFLGICAEVLILCTVILVYEKKRNKTEMEESDTDGSPEQKNTPDHGKDSDVRHRK